MPRKSLKFLQLPKELTPTVPDQASTYPSGRGASGGAPGAQWRDYPDRKMGQIPIPTRGEPSTDSSVNASEIMQNKVMNDDDKEWYDELNDTMVKNFLKPRNTVKHGFDVGLNCSLDIDGSIITEHCLKCVADLCQLHEKLLVEPDNIDRKKRKKKRESNAAGSGAVRGTNSAKQKKKDAEIYGRAFGGGSIINSF